jgi:hypothetical protein
MVMRSVLTLGGIETFISIYEGDLLARFGADEDKKIFAIELDERQTELAEGMARKGVLEVNENNEGKYYYLNINRF